jgi:glycosyltransferase involved in cell wall biosynthesis
MRRILMISEKFPPFNVSASARPFYFAKYLPEFGYEPHVIASTLRGADARDDALLEELGQTVRVRRTPRLLSPIVTWARARRGARSAPVVAAKGALAEASPAARSSTPNRWQEALFGLAWWSHWELDWSALATLAGLAQARQTPPDLIWVSGPHFRNYVVGLRLSLWLDKPLVVDMRDPWTYGSLWSPKTAKIAETERRWAERVLGHAAHVIFTSPLTLEAMHRRFPKLARDKLSILTNGFDATPVEPLREVSETQCLFRYIGMLNARRHPDPLIVAFARAAEDPEFRRQAVLEFIGNASGHDGKVSLAPGCDVRFVGHVSRADSVRYMFGSDVNVLLQTISEGQDVVSGKAFDYLHAQKPILAAVDEAGGDAWLVRETHSGRIAAWHDTDAIARQMLECFHDWQAGVRQIDSKDTARYSRRGLTERLARIFDQVLSGEPLATTHQ